MMAATKKKHNIETETALWKVDTRSKKGKCGIIIIGVFLQRRDNRMLWRSALMNTER